MTTFMQNHPDVIVAIVTVLAVGLLACVWVLMSGDLDEDQDDADEDLRKARLTSVR